MWNSNLAAFGLSTSPGAANYLADGRGIVIEEVLARNLTHNATAAGQFAGWIELHNSTAAAISLAGMSPSVNELWFGQWLFPVGALRPGAGASRSGATPLERLRWSTSRNSPGRALSGQGGGVYLLGATGQLVDVEYGFKFKDRSIGAGERQLGWLVSPPRGANAAPSELGSSLNVRLNEWLLNTDGPDWICPCNPGQAS